MSFRVRRYAGIDPLSGKRHHLTEVVPAGPKATARAAALALDRNQPRPRARSAIADAGCGELHASRWDHIDFATGVLDIRSATAQVNTRTWEKDTKTRRRRRIVIDAQTVALLRVYLHHAAATATPGRPPPAG